MKTMKIKSTLRANKVVPATDFGVPGFAAVNPYMRLTDKTVTENPAWDDAQYRVDVVFTRLPKRKRK